MVGRYLLIKKQIAMGIKSDISYYAFDFQETLQNVNLQAELVNKVSSLMNVNSKVIADTFTLLETKGTTKAYLIGHAKQTSSISFNQALKMELLAQMKQLKASASLSIASQIELSSNITNNASIILETKEAVAFAFDDTQAIAKYILNANLQGAESLHLSIVCLNQNSSEELNMLLKEAFEINIETIYQKVNASLEIVLELAEATLNYWDNYTLENLDAFKLKDLEKKQNI